jgi:phage shock protein A
MENMDLIFADNNEIIVDALAGMIRDQSEEIEELQHSIERLRGDLKAANKLNEMLKADLAAAKKAAKVTKVAKAPKSSIISKAEAQKISSAIGKRKPGRPKKAVK